MKFTSIFFTASAKNIRGLPQITTTSEKYEVYFDIFHSECQKYSRITFCSSSEISDIAILCKNE